MQGEYYTIFTKVGQAKIANAIALGKPMQIKYMAIGDGGGEVYEPDVNQTELRHEVYRAQASSVTVSDAGINQIQVSMLVPANVGGFVIREVGLFDVEGNLIAVSKPPADPKPALETGAAKDMQYNINITVDNMAAIELKVDPTVIIATKAELATAKSEMQGYTDNAAATAVQTAKDYADEQDAATDAEIDTHINNAVVHITADERAAWDAKATQEDLQQLAASSVVHYKGFADVNAAYTAATPLVDVVKAMADNSILFAVVEAANDDYPAAGNLQVIRYTDGRADCQLRSTDDDGKPTLWLANFTSEEIEQIFGGGG